MSEEQKAKLNDYLQGFLDLEQSGLFPVGAILIASDDRKEVLDVILKQKLSDVSDTNENCLQNNMAVLSQLIKEGKTIVIDSEQELTPMLYNLFLNFIRGTFEAEIPEKGRISCPVPEGSKILFVLPKELFDSSAYFGRIFTSVCRL